MTMNKINKEYINNLLYEGDKKSFMYDAVNKIISPYVDNNIQIGGNIEILFDGGMDEKISTLMNKNGYLDERYGGDISNKLDILYIFKTKSQLMNRYKKKYDRFFDELVEYENMVGIIEERIKKKTNLIYKELKNYLIYTKMEKLIDYLMNNEYETLNDVLTKKAKENIKKILKNNLENNNKKYIQFYKENIEKRINIYYKEYLKIYDKPRKFLGLILREIEIKRFNIILFGKKDIKTLFERKKAKLMTKEEKFKKKYDKYNFEDYIQRINIDTTNDKKINKKKTRFLKNIDEIELKRKNIQNMLSNLGDFNAKLEVNKDNVMKRFKDNKLNKEKYENIYSIIGNVYKNLDELIKISKDMVKIINNFNAFLDKMRNRLYNSTIGKKTIYYEVINNLYNICNTLGIDISNQIKKDAKNIKIKYTSKIFPNTFIYNDLRYLSELYNILNIKVIKEIDNRFSFFKEGDEIIIDETTILNFINNLLKNEIGLSGGYKQTGGELANYNENNYILHTYDMYIVFEDFTDKYKPLPPPSTTISLRNKQSHLRLLRTDTNNGLYMYIPNPKYNKPIEHILNFNDSPGYVMVTKEIDYRNFDHILSSFIYDIKKVCNVRRTPFIVYLYNNKLYIYIIKYYKSSINIYRLDKTIKVSKENNLLSRFKIYGEEYYTYIKNDTVKDELYYVPIFIKVKSNHTIDDKYMPYGQIGNINYKYNYYLPYDSLFNKLIISYKKIEDKYIKFNINKKADNLGSILTSTILNLRTFSPSNLKDLEKNIKFVLFFLDYNFSINDNKSYYMSDNMKENIIKTYDNYFDQFNKFIDMFRILTDINKKNNFLKNYQIENKKLILYNGNISKNELFEYFNVSNDNKLEKYIKIYKLIYSKIIKDIDPTLIKGKQIEGIELEKLINSKHTLSDETLNVFNKLSSDSYKKVIEENVKKFYKLIDDINNNNKINEYIEEINKINDDIKKIEESELFKDAKLDVMIPKSNSIRNFINNDTDTSITDINTQNIIKKYSSFNNIEQKSSIESMILGIYQYMDELMTEREKMLKNMNKEENINNVKKIKEIDDKTKQILSQYTISFSTEQGAENLINNLKELNTYENSDYFPNTDHRINSLKSKLLDSTDSKISKTIYRLYKYYEPKLNDNEDFKKAKKIYEEYVVEFENYINSELNKTKKKLEQSKKIIQPQTPQPQSKTTPVTKTT